MSYRLILAAAVAAWALTAAVAVAQPSSGEIDGTVTDAAGAPVDGAVVRIEPLGAETATDDHGHFHFDGLPRGDYTVVTDGPDGFSSRRAAVADALVRVHLRIELAAEGRVVVTASPLAGQSPLDMTRAVTVLGGDELAHRAGATIGETVAAEPGVTATGFGQGASRPLIRGLGDDRVRVLRSGIGTLDVSTVSDDHGVALEPLLVDQVEILRGPATLLYGSGAIGGVVNAVDSRIPHRAVAHGIESRVELRTASGNDERSAVARLDAGAAAGVTWHADAYRRAFGDYQTPAGRLHNSATRNAGGAFGASWITDRGFVGASVSSLDGAYGVPGGHDHDVRIAQRQTRVDIAGSWSDPWRGFELARWRFGSGDYEHRELEGDGVGTVFRNDAWEGRAEFTHAPAFGGWHGAAGVQASQRDFAALGDEAFTPPVVTRELGTFWVGERGFGRARVELGARAERVEHEPDAGARRAFTLHSASLGVAFRLAGEVEFAANAGSYERAPSAEALYSLGPHLASMTYERGDPALDSERSRAVEATLRDPHGGVRWTLTAFRNAFDDFIHQRDTGATDPESALRIVEYRQRDATFTGFEAEIEAELVDRDWGGVDVRTFADHVRAEFGDGTPVPRIPPRRVGVELTATRAAWTAQVDWTRVSAQRRIAPIETATPGHTLIGVEIARSAYVGPTTWSVFVRGTNLTDEDARRHVSFLKDVAPLPGRSWQLGVRVEF